MGYAIGGKGYTTQQLLDLAVRTLERKAHEGAYRRAQTLAHKDLAIRYPGEFQQSRDRYYSALQEQADAKKVPDGEIEASIGSGALQQDRRIVTF